MTFKRGINYKIICRDRRKQLTLIEYLEKRYTPLRSDMWRLHRENINYGVDNDRTQPPVIYVAYFNPNGTLMLQVGGERVYQHPVEKFYPDDTRWQEIRIEDLIDFTPIKVLPKNHQPFTFMPV